MLLKDLQIYYDEGELRGPPWRKDLRQLSGESNFLVSLYRRSLDGKSPPAITKITVALTESACDPMSNMANQGPKIFYFPWHYQLGDYLRLGEFERKKRLLALTHEILVWLAGKQGWDTACLESAYSVCLERNLENYGYWKNGKRWRSPNGLCYAKVFWVFTFEKIEVTAVIEDRKGNELGRRRLVELDPDDWELDFGEFRWLSNDRIALYSHRKLDKWVRSIKSIVKGVGSIG